MSKIFEFNIPHEEMQLVFDIMDFLENNKKELLTDIKPKISEFLKKESLFKGPYYIEFNKQFEQIVRNSLKDIIIDNFNLDPEKAIYSIELAELMEVLDYYLEKDKYFEN